MARLNNKFFLLDADSESDYNEQEQDHGQELDNKNNKDKSLIQEEEEIARAIKSHTTSNKKNRKKEIKTDEWTTPVNKDNKDNKEIITEEFKDSKDFKEHSDKKYIQPIRDDKLLENKELYDENKTYGDLGNDKKLNSYWTVWVHRTNCTDWKITGYQRVYIINSIGSFWRFFNNFQMLNTYQNNIFIMREEIAPIWEDVNNKFGGICSLKIDSTQRGLKTDISTEIFTIMSMLLMNETLVAKNKNINGISFGVKKRSTLIKVWTKTYDAANDFIKELPVPLINKFNVEMQKQSKSVLNNDGKISIQYKQIKPEYEL